MNLIELALMNETTFGRSIMKINELLNEMSASSVAAVGMGVGTMLTRQPKNSDGTAKNAQDIGKKKKKSKSKKA